MYVLISYCIYVITDMIAHVTQTIVFFFCDVKMKYLNLICSHVQLQRNGAWFEFEVPGDDFSYFIYNISMSPFYPDWHFCVPYNRRIGRSRVRFPMWLLEFFIDINLPALLWPWGRLTLTEISIRDIIWRVKVAGAYDRQPCHLHVLTVWEPQLPAALNACSGL